MSKLLHEKITQAIIGAAFEVYNNLGYGFLEKVYKLAMQVEMLERGHTCETEKRLIVKYKNVIVGEYYADLSVDDSVLVELKIAKELNPNDKPQLLNELKAANQKVGLLINFGKAGVEFARVVN